MGDARPIQQQPPGSMLAIFSLIFGILAWTLLPLMSGAVAWLNIFNFIALPLAGSVIAAVAGRIALKKIRTSEGALRGEGLAKAAMVLAYVQYSLVVLIMLFVLGQSFFRLH